MSSSPQLSTEHEAVLLSNSWFAGLPEAVRADLLSRARPRSVVARARVFARGEVVDAMYAVLEGTLRVSGLNREGRETILDFYGPGAWIGEVALLAGEPRSHDAHAEGPALLLRLDSPAVESLLASYPAFSRALLRLEAQRLLILLNALESYSTQTLPQRLASRLLMLAAHHGVMHAPGVRLELPLSQETLARLIGSTRQRVNQMMKSWEAEGIVRRHDRRLLLMDRARLEALARL